MKNPITIIHGDITQKKPGRLFHAVLCDPPYHLGQKGFMGKEWDAAEHGIAFKPETWASIGEHLHPGGFLMAFASSRGWHRLACAIEDAGFILHPTIFGWAFGSGFPKATRIDIQVDKRKDWKALHKFHGLLREHRSKLRLSQGNAARKCGIIAPDDVLGGDKERGDAGGYMWFESGLRIPTADQYRKLRDCDLAFEAADREIVGHDDKGKAIFGSCEGEYDITAPATPLARAWAGHRYGLQALKPAVEPIIVAQKPYEGKPVNCITKTGAGALNIDGGRIEGGSGDGYWTHKREIGGNGIYGGGGKTEDDFGNTNPNGGRWPANLILLDDEAARRLGEQSGVTKSCGGSGEASKSWRGDDSQVGARQASATGGFGDIGGASRFFFRVQEQLDEADPIHYQAKASRAERDAGLDELPLKERAQKYGLNAGGTTPQQTPHKHEPMRCSHPTVKPISLAKYLATLLLPPPDYAPRRILVPFAGVMSEAIGALQAGWEEIVAVEKEAEYIPIGQARIDYWFGKKTQ